MGKGDRKTRRGKITAGSYGKCRPKKSKKQGKVTRKKKARVRRAKK